MKKKSLWKSRLVLLMILCMVLSLTACGGKKGSAESTDNKEEQEKAVEVADKKYAELLAGGLNKEQFEFVLAHMPSALDEGSLSMDDLSNLLLYVSEFAYDDSPEISIDGWTEGYDANMYYNLSDVNNMIKIVTDFQFAEENNGQCRAASVAGDTFVFSTASPSTTYKADIDIAMIEKEEMTVFYTVEVISMEEGSWSEIRTATLSKNTEGFYQIKKISTDEVVIPTWQEQYETVIESNKDREGGYTLHDMDGDGKPELLLSIQDADFPDYYNWSIFTCNTQRGLMKELSVSYATGITSSTYLNPFGVGFVGRTTDRWNGDTYYTEIKISGEELVCITLRTLAWSDSEKEEYDANFTEKVEWTKFTDLSLLKNYQ